MVYNKVERVHAMSKSKSLVERLKDEIRKAEKRGLTRYRIAQISGVSQGQLSKIVSGKIVPKLDTAEKIIRALGKKILIGPIK